MNSDSFLWFMLLVELKAALRRDGTLVGQSVVLLNTLYYTSVHVIVSTPVLLFSVLFVSL